MPGGHWTRELFLDHEEIFLQIHEHGWEHGVEQAAGLKALFDRFGVPEGSRILDVPCGIGRHATRLAKMGDRTLGLDLSPTYVKRAQELARQEDVADRATDRLGDMRHLAASVPEDVRRSAVDLTARSSLGHVGRE